MQDVAPSRSLSKRPPAGPSSDLISLLSQKVMGQSNATKTIVPYVYMGDTGGGLTHDELMLCAERNLLVLYKPFLTDEVLNLIRAQYRRASSTAAVAR